MSDEQPDLVKPVSPGDRLTTQDALQLNFLYECPLQRTLPCKKYRHLAESVYLASRRCDGISDCSDGSDEVSFQNNREANNLTLARLRDWPTRSL